MICLLFKFKSKHYMVVVYDINQHLPRDFSLRLDDRLDYHLLFHLMNLIGHPGGLIY